MEQAWQTIAPILIYVGGISLAVSLVIFVIYLPPILHKYSRIAIAKQIIEQNIKVVEEALFFKSNTKFQEIIDKQVEDIKTASLELKKAKATLEQVNAEIKAKDEELEAASRKKSKK